VEPRSGTVASAAGSAASGGEGSLTQSHSGTPGSLAGTGSSAGTSTRAGEVHDTLWIPESSSPLEGVGVSAPLAEASGAVYDTAPTGSPGLAADLGTLDLTGGLQQAIETLHATVELAARQGISQARIALRPQELGDIRIHLTQTAEGLLARVTADTPAAAQALAAGHAELRQSLGTLGLNLTRLHIGHSGQATVQGDGATAQGRGGDDRSGARAGLFGSARTASRTNAIDASDGTPGPAAAQVEPIPPPSSSRALVDILV
jgi:flagellar hook-length control protein FliK